MCVIEITHPCPIGLKHLFSNGRLANTLRCISSYEKLLFGVAVSAFYEQLILGHNWFSFKETCPSKTLSFACLLLALYPLEGL